MATIPCLCHRQTEHCLIVKSNQPIPPKLAGRLLTSFLRDDLLEEVLGDLEEKFQETAKTKSLFRAKINYWYQAFNYLRPFAWRKSKAHPLNQYDMIQTYFKIGWRSLVKQKMYSAIKVGGFAIGITACLLISLYIKDEMSYDLHYPDSDRIYRVLGVITEEGDIKRGVAFPAPMGPALKEDFPEVEKSGRFNGSELFGAGSNEVRPGGEVENSYDEGFTYFDQELMDMLQFKFIHGNAARAMDQPHSIVITQRKAEKYFPNENPVGKTLIINNDEGKPYTIGGVIENFKTTSHIQFDFLISTKGLEFWQGEQKNWGASNYATYILVHPGTNISALEQKISDGIIDKYFLPMMTQSGMSVADVKTYFKEKNAHLELQPLNKIHLFSSDIQEDSNRGDIRFIWIFGGIALFILLIAIINFINLSTAKSANRAKEVGLRKVVGSFRSNIINQFLIESILYSVLSFGVGIILARVLLPYFNLLSAKSLSFPWQEWWLFPIIMGAAVLIGILAGLYPSFYLSSFQPIQVLKGDVSRGSKSSPLRSGLVIFQFTTSIVLIIGTFVIYKQMDFILNRNIGFEKDQVVMIQGANTLGNQMNTFKNELLTVPHVEAVSVSDYLPIKGTKRNQNQFWNEGDNHNQDNAVAGQFWLVDYDYIKTMGMKIADGRDFKSDMTTDSTAMIINQTMAKELGGNVIGKRITNGGDRLWVIIGVVEDFHFESMREHIGSLCFVLGKDASIISVKVSSTNMSDFIASMAEVLKKFAPNQPIRFAFMDESYAAMYADVQRMGNIFTSFAVFAIIVACLGLFALSAFMVEQRSKEISIRLVLGAPFRSIFNLLTLDFLKLVLIAIIISVPIAWYTMQKWLQDFTYRIEISWDVFVIAGMIAIIIAILTISYQSIKAALMNPVNSLKNE